MRKLTVLAVAIVMSLGVMAGCGSKTAETDLVNYDVYQTMAQEYKDLSNELVVKYMNEGMDSEEACAQAITDVIDVICEDTGEWIDTYCMDLDGNGISDKVDSGEITIEEYKAMELKYCGVVGGEDSQD